MTATVRRRFIALSAAYAVALQAVVASFALVAMAGRPAQEMCTPAGSGQSLPPGDACWFCPATCADDGFAGLPPPFYFVATVAPQTRPACACSAALPCSTPRLLPPSRAPPAA